MCPPVLMRRLYRPCTHPPTSTLRSCKQSPKERERQTARRPTARRLARSRAPLLGNKNHDGACPPGPGQSRHLRRRPWLSVRCLGRRLCSPALKWIGQGSFGVARGAGTSSREESFFPADGGGEGKVAEKRALLLSSTHTHSLGSSVSPTHTTSHSHIAPCPAEAPNRYRNPHRRRRRKKSRRAHFALSCARGAALRRSHGRALAGWGGGGRLPFARPTGNVRAARARRQEATWNSERESFRLTRKSLFARPPTRKNAATGCSRAAGLGCSRSGTPGCPTSSTAWRTRCSARRRQR